MIDTFSIYNELKDSLGDEGARKLVKIFQKLYEELSDTVKREDFNRLTDIVARLLEAQEKTDKSIKELTQAQKDAEQRLSKLEKVVEELAQAQKNTEKRVEELVQAQKNAEQRLTRLEKAVEGLTQAQKKTEQRVSRLEKIVEELAQAQKNAEQRLTRLEKAVEELAQAQRRTEERLEELIGEHQKTREQLGGLSATVGYRLEDEAFKALPELLKRDYGIVLQEGLKRRYIRDNRGRMMEVNIIGKGKRDGKIITVIGEGKSQLSKNDVDRFIRRKLKQLEGVFEEIFPVLVTYMISQPDVEEYTKKKGIALYYSYDF